MFHRYGLAVGLLILCPSLAAGQDPSPTSSGTGRALILCGLSGDRDHHKLFSQTLTTLSTGLSARCDIAPQAVTLLTGDEPASDDPEFIRQSPRATREQIAETVAKLKVELSADDRLWVIVLGHTYYDGRVSWLNLPGPDLSHTDFAKLFEDVPCREQIFVLTTSTSGNWIKPLSAKGRTVLAATETDWETNETEFPHELARLMAAEDFTTKDLDADQDGKFTMLDLYVTTVRNLAQSYFGGELLATEHALLDDDGDGRGTELQVDYLTVDLGGRLQPNRPFKPPTPSRGDGLLAKTIVLKSVDTLPEFPPADALDVYPPREQ
ncbi:MAG TPA: hypothetical protein VFG20_10320 [Planctomycetaceae bacterium]|jgi:hypothetical protein|nr:hypothetical protein [Planctomycetaceae bacterium]